MLSNFAALTTNASKPFSLALIIAAAVAMGGCVSESSSSSGGSSSSGSGNPVSSQPSDSSGQVHLSWVEPSQRENGHKLELSEIDSFEVHYGLVSDDFTEMTVVPYPDVSVAINSLDAGHWRFAVRTVDTDGRKSRFSDEKRIHIN
ncbi:MAG: hypothetical protein JJU06_16845 [Ectothiorhodospiraceae bacterium]|nr:hypothetical protein [Ectothiorhodospiraceae bacterium]MCH8506992.1 hypothetical protein [Ectothiorhodospiraceae bacterium]